MKDPLVGVIMGSRSDWETMKHAVDTLEELGIATEPLALSAHRTPHEVADWASSAEDRGFEVIIAAAGGAAHLAGVVAAHTVLPVLGVPMKAWSLDGLDSLLSTVQMPRGVPVGTLAIGKAGAVNAALLAAQILGNKYPEIRESFRGDRMSRKKAVLDGMDPRT
ncbi:MAG: 5-(carboxyamino)imidazole ribonucleotide mutase [Gemmatimonadetes bacterium]|nr:5-(carboxyamino)imidazole ribonucleotide mutase [Gemmatimonadota bacterium]NNM04101.1 5-(carboxyamino)imidazole ribonucleotide mutase [Gemmatimonadota bacterium]